MKQKHKHYDVIVAWAAGEEIESLSHGPVLFPEVPRWLPDRGQCWFHDVEYRVKPQPKPDLVREALIVNSLSAGPMLCAASPSEANIVLLFDGETGKLKQCTIKGA